MAVEQFGHTWWGRAWVEALEQRAGVDPARLERGRSYARQDRVTSLSLEPGQVVASVRGSRRLNYRTHVDLRTFDDGQWAEVLATVAGRSGHTAALLDGDLEPGVVDDARQVGVELLPTPGDLKFRCSCPDVATPCKHAAAVCYLVSEALDDDPFVLFAMRGRARTRLIAELRDARQTLHRSSTDGGEEELSLSGLRIQGSGDDPGLVARLAWSRERTPLPPALPVPDAPGTPAAWPDDPPPDAPFDAPGLLALAAEASRRAWDQIRGDGSSGLQLGEEADRARRGAEALERGDGEVPAAPATGSADLGHRSLAWRHGGEEGLAAIDEAPWRAPVAVMAAARSAVEAAGVSPSVLTVSNNRITGPGFQLRVTRHGRWWRFAKRRGRWVVDAPPADEVEDLIGS